MRKNLKKTFLTLLAVVTLAVIFCFGVGALEYVGYEYSELDDGTVIILDYTGNSTNLVIPDEIYGKSVTAIAGRAFANHTDIESVIIPDSVIYIWDDAFKLCTNLRELIIGDGVKEIKQYAFYGCSKLTKLVIPDNVGKLGKAAFSECYGITELTIPINVNMDTSRTGGYATFEGCTNIKKVTFTKGNGYSNNYSTISHTSTPYLYKTPWYISDCTTIVIEDGVKSIGNYTFYGKNIKEINIPDSVETIGSFSFSECSNLEKVINCSGVKNIKDNAFSGCVSLVDFNVPSSVTNIGEKAFSGCESLKRITIPDDGYIGKMAFSGCSGVVELSMPVTTEPGDYFEGVTNVDKMIFTKGTTGIMKDYGEIESEYSYKLYGSRPWVNCSSIVIEEGVKNIGNMAFHGCNKIKEITISDSITSIGVYAFFGCENLISISIPDSVTSSIGDYAFYQCKNLQNVNIGKNITSIGMNAFAYCFALKEIVITDKVTSIGKSAFHSCQSLKDITISSAVKSIGSNAFGYCYVENVHITDMASWCAIDFEDYSSNPLNSWGDIHRLYLNGEIVTDLVIPEGTTRIGNYAFYGYKLLTNVKLSDSVKYVGNYAFYDCENIKEVTLGNSVEKIGERGFSYCRELTDITIGSSLKNVGEDAFWWAAVNRVFYSGCKSDWEGILFEGINNQLIFATIHFNGCKDDSTVINVTIEPTCTVEGIETHSCMCSSRSETKVIPSTGHSYGGDNICDTCGYDRSEDCSCNCHKSGFSGFIWKILRFFYKLFKTNPICACGMAHY